jgi:hypothetical protein
LHRDVVHDLWIGRQHLHGVDPQVLGHDAIGVEVAEVDGALGGDLDRVLELEHEVGFADRPALAERARHRRLGWIALGSAGLDPRQQGRTLVLGESPVVAPRPAVRSREPGRHDALLDHEADHRLAAADLGITLERERRGAAGAMALDAALLEDARDLAVVGRGVDRRRARLGLDPEQASRRARRGERDALPGERLLERVAQEALLRFLAAETAPDAVVDRAAVDERARRVDDEHLGRGARAEDPAERLLGIVDRETVEAVLDDVGAELFGRVLRALVQEQERDAADAELVFDARELGRRPPGHGAADVAHGDHPRRARVRQASRASVDRGEGEVGQHAADAGGTGLELLDALAHGRGQRGVDRRGNAFRLAAGREPEHQQGSDRCSTPHRVLLIGKRTGSGERRLRGRARRGCRAWIRAVRPMRPAEASMQALPKIDPERVEAPQLRLLEGRHPALELGAGSLGAWILAFGTLSASGGHGLFLVVALTKLSKIPSLAEIGGPLHGAVVAWFVAAIPLALLALVLRRRFPAPARARRLVARVGLRGPDAVRLLRLPASDCARVLSQKFADISEARSRAG